MVVMVVSYNMFVGYIVYIYHSILVMVVSYKMYQTLYNQQKCIN